MCTARMFCNKYLGNLAGSLPWFELDLLVQGSVHTGICNRKLISKSPILSWFLLSLICPLVFHQGPSAPFLSRRLYLDRQLQQQAASTTVLQRRQIQRQVRRMLFGLFRPVVLLQSIWVLVSSWERSPLPGSPIIELVSNALF